MSASVVPTHVDHKHPVFLVGLGIVKSHSPTNDPIPVFGLTGTKEEIKGRICEEIDRLFKVARRKKI